MNVIQQFVGKNRLFVITLRITPLQLNFNKFYFFSEYHEAWVVAASPYSKIDKSMDLFKLDTGFR